MNKLIETLQNRVSELETQKLELERALQRAENAHLVLMDYYARHKQIIDQYRAAERKPR